MRAHRSHTRWRRYFRSSFAVGSFLSCRPLWQKSLARNRVLTCFRPLSSVPHLSGAKSAGGAGMRIRAASYLAISFNVMAASAGAQQRLDLSFAPSQWATSNPHPAQHGDRYYTSGAAQNQPAPADGRDLSIDVRTQNGAPGTISMGSVGLDSKVGASSQAATGDYRYSSSGAGLRLKVPLENDKYP